MLFAKGQCHQVQQIPRHENCSAALKHHHFGVIILSNPWLIRLAKSLKVDGCSQPNQRLHICQCVVSLYGISLVWRAFAYVMPRRSGFPRSQVRTRMFDKEGPDRTVLEADWLKKVDDNGCMKVDPIAMEIGP